MDKLSRRSALTVASVAGMAAVTSVCADAEESAKYVAKTKQSFKDCSVELKVIGPKDHRATISVWLKNNSSGSSFKHSVTEASATQTTLCQFDGEDESTQWKFEVPGTTTSVAFPKVISGATLKKFSVVITAVVDVEKDCLKLVSKQAVVKDLKYEKEGNDVAVADLLKKQNKMPCCVEACGEVKCETGMACLICDNMEICCADPPPPP